MWFLAMWFVTSQKNGVSALGLQRALGLGSYETAWTWLHKLRRAMVRPGRDCLTGTVEVDETYVGGPEEGKRGRGAEAKTIVAVAAEKSGRAIGRIRLRRIKDVSADSLLPFVQSVVAPGSAVHTDGWRGYSGLANAGYQHQITVISDGLDPAHEVMPRVHTIASLLKRWLLGTRQGGIQQQHLDYYLDEFTFRFNRRRSNARGLQFHRLARQAIAVSPRLTIRLSVTPGRRNQLNGCEGDTPFTEYALKGARAKASNRLLQSVVVRSGFAQAFVEIRNLRLRFTQALTAFAGVRLRFAHTLVKLRHLRLGVAQTPVEIRDLRLRFAQAPVERIGS
jgi:transposase-like protein